MQFAICNSDHIARHASAHASAILSHLSSRDAVDMNAESLVITAVENRDYTRSVAIVARQISNRLRCEDALLTHKFTECVIDAVMAVFFAYWRAQRLDRAAPESHALKRITDAVDPIALCAFVGDLFSVKILEFREFEECVSSLLTFSPSTLLVECLYALFAHGGAHRHPEMTLPYLLKCISSIETKCASYRGLGFLKETKLTGLIYEIMFSVDDDFVDDVVDGNLDLDNVLTGSVHSPLNAWLYDTRPSTSSPGVRTSTSSASTLCVPIAGHSKIDANLPQTRHHTDSPISIVTEQMGSASIEEPLVLHMPRPVSGVQWATYFREYSA